MLCNKYVVNNETLHSIKNQVYIRIGEADYYLFRKFMPI